MKVLITLLLLFGIAISIMVYYSHGEHPSEDAPFFVIPILIEILLLFIFFFSYKNTTYRKVFKIVLIVWSIIFVFMMIVCAYLMGLGGAFSH